MLPENKTKLARVRNAGRWHSRGSDWATPKELFDTLNAEFGFTLDVRSAEWNKKVDNFFSEAQNGLAQSWSGNVCWMNPPYGKALNDWMKKAYEESQRGVTVVCLVPAATDTHWWHEYAMRGEIRFLRGRPRFTTPEGTWQQTFSPSVIVIFRGGQRCRKIS